MKLSLMSLGDHIADPVTRARATPAERHRMLVEAAVLAESAGFHGVNVGEHHGLEYIYSAPPVILAAIAERTSTLRLGTAVTLLANLDPLRVAEDYATVDVLSGGRVEVVAGRGNFFVSTYELFGQSIDESRGRFDEAAELLQRLWSEPRVTWRGRYRAPIDDISLQPPPLQRPHPPIWIGGGASPETAELAARLGLKLMLPSAFGNPEVFAPVAEAYRTAFRAAGHRHDPEVGACWHVNVAINSQDAKRRWRPRYEAYHTWMKALLHRVNPEPPSYLNKPFDYEWLLEHGPAVAGSPAEVVERLESLGELLGADTHLLYMDMGGLPQAELLAMVDLIGSEVIPALGAAHEIAATTAA